MLQIKVIQQLEWQTCTSIKKEIGEPKTTGIVAHIDEQLSMTTVYFPIFAIVTEL